MDTKAIEIACAKLESKRMSRSSKHKIFTAQSTGSIVPEGMPESRMSSFDGDFDFYDPEASHKISGEGTTETDIESKSSDISIISKRFSMVSRLTAASVLTPKLLEDKEEELDEEEDAEELEEEEHEEVPTEKSSEEMDPDTKIENHFIDVGSLTFGGIFGLGETLEHRVIMARTTVQCFLIPRFWLFEKNNNPAGIWDRRRLYLETNIPSIEALFQNFLTTRKWQKFKRDLIESNVADALKYNPTKVQDIPIICRIVEATDD